MDIRVSGMETPACPQCHSKAHLAFQYDISGIEVWHCRACNHYFDVERVAEEA